MGRARRTVCVPPVAVRAERFSGECELPYGLNVGQIRAAMDDFVSFIHLVDSRLHRSGMAPLETTLMPANFSSVVGEFMVARLDARCPTLAKNRYHNGHPDLIPTGQFPGDAAQHSAEGVEVKASRYLSGWQGHNPEETWLMVFAFQSSRPVDRHEGRDHVPFGFVKVVGAQLTRDDWSFSGRKGDSRRTITASVRASGYARLEANWIYRDRDLLQTH
jgi:hypothetical protein